MKKIKLFKIFLTLTPITITPLLANSCSQKAVNDDKIANFYLNIYSKAVQHQFNLINFQQAVSSQSIATNRTLNISSYLQQALIDAKNTAKHSYNKPQNYNASIFKQIKLSSKGNDNLKLLISKNQSSLKVYPSYLTNKASTLTLNYQLNINQKIYSISTKNTFKLQSGFIALWPKTQAISNICTSNDGNKIYFVTQNNQQSQIYLGTAQKNGGYQFSLIKLDCSNIKINNLVCTNNGKSIYYSGTVTDPYTKATSNKVIMASQSKNKNWNHKIIYSTDAIINNLTINHDGSKAMFWEYKAGLGKQISYSNQSNNGDYHWKNLLVSVHFDKITFSNDAQSIIGINQSGKIALTTLRKNNNFNQPEILNIKNQAANVNGFINYTNRKQIFYYDNNNVYTAKKQTDNWQQNTIYKTTSNAIINQNSKTNDRHNLLLTVQDNNKQLLIAANWENNQNYNFNTITSLSKNTIINTNSFAISSNNNAVIYFNNINQQLLGAKKNWLF